MNRLLSASARTFQAICLGVISVALFTGIPSELAFGETVGGPASVVNCLTYSVRMLFVVQALIFLKATDTIAGDDEYWSFFHPKLLASKQTK